MTALGDLGVGVDEVWLRSEALAAGHTEKTVRALVRSGDWVRLRHGTYTSGATWAAADERRRHQLLVIGVVKRAQSDIVISHESSAVALHGVPTWQLDLDVVHSTRRDERAGRVEAGVHQHQGVLLAEDVVSVGGVEFTSATRTAIDVTTRLPVEVSLGIVNHLLHQRATHRDALLARYETMQRHPSSRGTRVVLDLARAEIESLAESRAFYWCWRGGLPCPEPQYDVSVDGRVVARLDFAWPALGKWLEVDGKTKYTKLLKPGQDPGDAVWEEKKREDLVRRLTGWQCLRITWADLENPARLVALIRDFLELA
jgi:hypothetical protein